MVCVIQITGDKDVGKTLLAVKIIEEAKRRGMRVLAVKQSHHQPDVPDKDSYRMREAGADYVALHGPGLWAFCSASLPEISLEFDLAVVEGFRARKLGFKVHIGPNTPADADVVFGSADAALEASAELLLRARCGVDASALLDQLRRAQ